MKVDIGIRNRFEISGWITTADGITRSWEVHNGSIIIEWNDDDDDRLIDEPDELMRAISAAVTEEEDHNPR